MFNDDSMIYGNSSLLKEVKQNLGKCQECGATFEQGYRINKKTGEKIFNKFKYCTKCRNQRDKNNDGDKVTNVSIKYDPYPWQKKFHASKARFKTVSGAARSGKDYSFDKEFATKFVEMLNEDRSYSLVPRVHGWVIGPTYKLLSQIERNFLHDFPRELVVNYDKENHAIDTINGGLIEFRSADDPDSLVSVGLDICYITEAARIKQFDIVIGNLTDRLDSPGRGPNGTGGLGLINSSPRGRTYFNEVCRWGIEGGSKQRPGWETWYISRWDTPKYQKMRYKYFNPTTSKWELDNPKFEGDRTYEQDLMLSRSDRQYREDILGIPSDDAGSQFPNFRDEAVVDKPNLDKEGLKEYKRQLRTPNPYYTYSIGYDPAKQIDGACAVVYCEQTGDAVELLRLQNVNYTEQINVWLKQLSQKWNNAIVRYGKTGLGEALEDLFKLAGIPYIAYPEQGKNKEKLVENLTTLVKSGKFRIHNVDDLAEVAVRQFEDYGYDISEKGKTMTYGNMTAGEHDDFVSASYFSVADVTSSNVDDVINFYDSNSLFLINNKYSAANNLKGGFY